MAVRAQDCHALVSHFGKGYKGRYGMDPVVNRHSARWGMDSILQGMAPSEVKELIDYYFTLTMPKRHSLEWFFYNYDKLIAGRNETDKDRERREKMRRESEQRAKEWKERFGNQGIAND